MFVLFATAAVLCRFRAVNAAGTDFELDVKYEMIKPIGHGAYGVVISALDHESNSKVRDQRTYSTDISKGLGVTSIMLRAGFELVLCGRM